MSDAREDETGGSMLKSLFTIAVAAAVAAGIGYADQSANTKVVVPVSKTPANNGKQMYKSYCASCHGEYGKGNGPVAPALKQQPTDLSSLSKNNGGKFPSEHVAAVLEFGADTLAHGNSSMPVWGPVLSKLDSSSTQRDMMELRISNLSRYIESLQQK
jgi:mono/diheme cytochrome c family protein